MKKLLTLAAVLGTTAASFGQGYVNFANTSASRVSNAGVLQTAGPVGNYYYALLIAPSTQNTVGSSDGSFVGWQLAAEGTNTASAGRLTGNNVDAGTGVAVNSSTGFGAGSTADFVIVGWSGNIGSDWTAVRAGFHGFGAPGTWVVTDASRPGGGNSAWFVVSAVAQDIILQPQGSSYNSVFGAAAIPGLNMQSIALIPEPTSLGLIGVGAAALVIFRRRKE